ncbi:PepSY-like domain-containing protein [Aquirufa nivalisilvae]
MKNQLLTFALVASVGLASCSKEDALNPTSDATGFVSQNFVPTAVKTTVTNTYPSAQVDYYVLQSNSLYGANIVLSNTESQVVLSKTGEIKEAFTRITETELPAAITTYLKGKYASYTFIHAGKKTSGTPITYRVEIKVEDKVYSILFDETGAVISTIEGKKGEKGGKGMGAAVSQLALTDLPAAVQAAITGYTFKNAVMRLDENGVATYHVHAEKDGKVWDLKLDASGKILSSEEESKNDINITKTDISTLPQAIIDYLNKNAAGWTLKNAVSVQKDNVAIHYHVVVTVGGNSQTYMFDKDFNYIANAGKGPKDNPSPANFTITEITKDNIPSTAISYLDKTYAGWALTKAVSVSKDGAAYEIEVIITVADKKYKVEFDLSGNFKSAHKL